MQLFSSENSTAKCSDCQRHLFFSLSVTLSISVSDLSLKQKDSNKTTKTRTANAQNNNERKKQNLFMPPEGRNCLHLFPKNSDRSTSLP